MRGTVLLCLPLALLLSACGAENSRSPVFSEATTAAPTTQDPFVADQALIRALYDGHSQAFSDGLDAAAAYTAENNHPDFAYTAEECRSAPLSAGLSTEYTETVVPDVAAMTLDPDWSLPDTRYAGLAPTGRTYIVPIEVTQNDPNAGLVDETYSAEVHATILNGVAYYFQTCENA